MYNHRPTDRLQALAAVLLLALSILYGCANRVPPGGGPYDDLPPVLLRSTPEMGAINQKSDKVTLYFDEYIKVEDVASKVIVSPPQLQQPRISAIGKRVVVELQDSLKPNTTYTIDFTDAIVDNNESNPLENFSYAFSTGPEIDTMQIAGVVLNARDLEPVKGVLVGIHPAGASETIFRDSAFVRMSRTSERATFVMRNVRAGSYHVYALKESNGNYRHDVPSEGVAFLDSLITTRSTLATRNDTIRKDSLTIDTVLQVPYTRFLPDDLVLLYYEGVQGRRYIAERKRPDSLTIELKYNLPVVGEVTLHRIDTLTAPTAPADTMHHYVVDHAAEGWVRFFLTDPRWQSATTFGVSYYSVDSVGLPTLVTDTMQLRVARPETKKREGGGGSLFGRSGGEETDSVPREVISPLTVRFERKGAGGTADSMLFVTSLPIDTTAFAGVQLVSVRDSVETPVEQYSLTFEPRSATRVLLRAPWAYGQKYELRFDTLLFRDVYGHTLAKRQVEQIEIKPRAELAQLEVEVSGVEGPFVFELLNKQDQVQAQVVATEPRVTFKDIAPGEYGLRMIVDQNGNGQWDPGDYLRKRQPEQVYYLPKVLNMMKNWRMKENWQPRALPLLRQKPSVMIRNKPQEKKRRDLNRERDEQRRQRGQTPPGGFGGFGGGGIRNRQDVTR